MKKKIMSFDCETNGLWGTAYFVISAANNVIFAIDNNDELTSSSVTQADLNNLKAEALALRALAHFDLLRIYSRLNGTNGEYGVCVITEPQLPTDMPARASVEETFAQIIKDLTDAESRSWPAYICIIRTTPRLPSMRPRSSTAVNSASGRPRNILPSGVRMWPVTVKSSSKSMASRPMATTLTGKVLPT